jgi:hypothetical protein
MGLDVERIGVGGGGGRSGFGGSSKRGDESVWVRYDKRLKV